MSCTPSRSESSTLIVMGVSGSGKTTIADELVAQSGYVFAEGDEFHPQANVAKMHAGHPLDDEDRWPWLRSVAAWIGERERAGASAVLTCSALKRSYRELLRDGHPSVWFVHLTLPSEVIDQRLQRRQGHYMPASLLQSQLDILEPLAVDEPGVTVAGDASPAEVATEVLEALRQHRCGALDPSGDRSARPSD
ncbi:MAG: gluconokinase [Mycobacteriaceae bacterium]